MPEQILQCVLCNHKSEPSDKVILTQDPKLGLIAVCEYIDKCDTRLQQNTIKTNIDNALNTC
jgi:hypothetical protein